MTKEAIAKVDKLIELTENSLSLLHALKVNLLRKLCPALPWHIDDSGQYKHLVIQHRPIAAKAKRLLNGTQNQGK